MGKPDQFDQIHTALKLCTNRPPVKPPTRKIQMLRTKIEGFTAPCTNCKKRAGKYTCSRCNALNFCSQECQREFWPEHREDCNEIRKWKEDVRGLANGVNALSEYHT